MPSAFLSVFPFGWGSLCRGGACPALVFLVNTISRASRGGTTHAPFSHLVLLISPYRLQNRPAISNDPPLSASKLLILHKSPPQNIHYEQNMTKMLGGCFNLLPLALTHMGRHAILQASKQAGEIRNCLYRQRISDREWILMAFHSFVTSRCLMEAFAAWRNSSRSSTTTTVVFRCR